MKATLLATTAIVLAVAFAPATQAEIMMNTAEPLYTHGMVEFTTNLNAPLTWTTYTGHNTSDPAKAPFQVQFEAAGMHRVYVSNATDQQWITIEVLPSPNAYNASTADDAPGAPQEDAPMPAPVDAVPDTGMNPLLFVVPVVLVLLGAGIGGFFWYQRRQGTPEEDDIDDYDDDEMDDDVLDQFTLEATQPLDDLPEVAAPEWDQQDAGSDDDPADSFFFPEDQSSPVASPVTAPDNDPEPRPAFPPEEPVRGAETAPAALDLSELLDATLSKQDSLWDDPEQ